MKIIIYILVTAGIITFVYGFIKDIDLITFAGLFFVITPLMLKGTIINFVHKK